MIDMAGLCLGSPLCLSHSSAVLITFSLLYFEFFICDGESEVWACSFGPGNMGASGNNVVAYVV